MSGELLALGADGDKRGWVAAAQYADGSTNLQAFPTVRELWSWREGQPGGESARVLIDAPIGLLAETGYRPCDRDAIARLGARRWSVFLAPGRYLLAACEDGLRGRELFARVQEVVAVYREAAADPDAVKGMSSQATGILLKVRELDDFLAQDPTRHEVLAECHPEVCFALMSDSEPLSAKDSALGQLRRLDLVRAAFADSEQAIRDWQESTRRSLLDILDAYAALWSALRWRAGSQETLGDGAPDAHTGGPIRMLA